MHSHAPRPVSARLASCFRLLMVTLVLGPMTLLADVPGAWADEQPDLAALAARPVHIALQVGHWKSHELPAELSRLRTSTGGSGGGVREVDVNLAVTDKVAEQLRAMGHRVDVLPATVPPGYQAEIFVSIHADATASSAARGFKLARSRFSRLPRTEDALIAVMTEEYGRATGLPWSRSITRNMTGYYAFSGRFRHSIAPTTPGVILEMGYLTNAADRALLTSGQDRVVTGIVRGLARFAANLAAGGQQEQLTAPLQPDCRHFPETDRSVCGPFLHAWEQQGGLTRFGLPISAELEEGDPATGKERTVQYFERTRFEYVRSQAGTEDAIQFGLLGRMATAGREDEQAFLPILPFADYEERRFFPESGHSLAGGFKHYWSANGGLEVFGFPISEEFQEVNPADGQTYTVQYFERARFEYHPEHKGTPYETQLGHLGRQVYAQR